mmetsp:Transcript_63935/g.119985  ORF Transcript_63935/g.119985 Transcript_63935/m.119985 type:complete len:236 (-) Transcript_63935:746-1453(-)
MRRHAVRFSWSLLEVVYGCRVVLCPAPWPMGRNDFVTPVTASGSSKKAAVSSHLPPMLDATSLTDCRPPPPSSLHRTLISISSTLFFSSLVACFASKPPITDLKLAKQSSGVSSSSARRFTKTRLEVVTVTRLSKLERSSWSKADTSALSAPSAVMSPESCAIERTNKTRGFGARPVTALRSTPKYAWLLRPKAGKRTKSKLSCRRLSSSKCTKVGRMSRLKLSSLNPLHCVNEK